MRGTLSSVQHKSGPLWRNSSSSHDWLYNLQQQTVVNKPQRDLMIRTSGGLLLEPGAQLQPFITVTSAGRCRWRRVQLALIMVTEAVRCSSCADENIHIRWQKREIWRIRLKTTYQLSTGHTCWLYRAMAYLGKGHKMQVRVKSTLGMCQKPQHLTHLCSRNWWEPNYQNVKRRL